MPDLITSEREVGRKVLSLGGETVHALFEHPDAFGQFIQGFKARVDLPETVLFAWFVEFQVGLDWKSANEDPRSLHALQNTPLLQVLDRSLDSPERCLVAADQLLMGIDLRPDLSLTRRDPASDVPSDPLPGGAGGAGHADSLTHGSN